MSKKYVLMCDYGLDDAAATAFVLDNRKAGDSVDVMPIGGNSEKSVAYRNGQTLLARYEGSLDGVRSWTREKRNSLSLTCRLSTARTEWAIFSHPKRVRFR